MTMATAVFQRGETVSVFAGLYIGATGDVTGTPVCKLKAARSAHEVPKSTDPVIAALTVTQQAASGDLPAGWLATLDDDACEDLEPGFYVLDMVFTVGGGRIVSEPCQIRIVERVTR